MQAECIQRWEVLLSHSLSYSASAALHGLLAVRVRIYHSHMISGKLKLAISAKMCIVSSQPWHWSEMCPAEIYKNIWEKVLECSCSQTAKWLNLATNLIWALNAKDLKENVDPAASSARFPIIVKQWILQSSMIIHIWLIEKNLFTSKRPYNTPLV